MFAPDRNTELILSNITDTILTLAIPAMLPIYVMVLMFDIVMVIVKFSSTESDHEASLFKKVMIFEIGFVLIIIYAWIPYFSEVFG